MPSTQLKHGHTYEAAADTIFSAETVRDKLVEKGFVNVSVHEVAEEDYNLLGQGTWTGDDRVLDLPSQIVWVRDITPPARAAPPEIMTNPGQPTASAPVVSTEGSIKVYVPRLASGLFALDAMETGLEPEPDLSFRSARWDDELATSFVYQTKRVLGFVPSVTGRKGDSYIYVHASTERFKPFQDAVNQARNQLGIAAPADPAARRAPPEVGVVAEEETTEEVALASPVPATGRWIAIGLTAIGGLYWWWKKGRRRRR